MMSWPCVLAVIGIIFILLSFSPHFAFISGVIADVVQVSMMSVSGTNSFEPHLHFFFGFVFMGSTGSWLSSASAVSPHFLQCHAGNCTPKYLCLDMHQSEFRPSTHCLYRTLMCSGNHLTFIPSSIHFSFISSTRMYHCCEIWNSAGVPHLSWILTL